MVLVTAAETHSSGTVGTGVCSRMHYCPSALAGHHASSCDHVLTVRDTARHAAASGVRARAYEDPPVEGRDCASDTLEGHSGR